MSTETIGTCEECGTPIAKADPFRTGIINDRQAYLCYACSLTVDCNLYFRERGGQGNVKQDATLPKRTERSEGLKKLDATLEKYMDPQPDDNVITITVRISKEQLRRLLEDDQE